jgi:integrase
VTLDAVSAHLAEFPCRSVEMEDRTDPRRTVRRKANLLLTLESGEPVTRHTWSKIWRPAARAANLPPGTGLHALRHLYASLLIRHGESVKVVERRLGHASAVMTLDLYSHLWPDADDLTREAVQQAMNELAADWLRTEGVIP